MESIARIQPSEAQEAEKSAELEALRAIYMEEITVFEDDPALFKIELLSAERKDPVRTVLKFRHPPLYPDEVLQVSAETLEGLPPSYKERLTAKMQEKAAELVGSASAFPIVELAKEWIERAAIEEENLQDNTFFKALTQTMQSEEEDIAETKDYVSYDCWTEEDLLARQNKKARQVAEALALAVPLATVLLRYFEWNVDKLYAQYLRQPDQVLQAAGVRVAPVATPQAHASCLICDEPPSAVRVEKFLSCGHTVCVECWVQYLTVKVQNGEVNSVRCPAFKCVALVPDDVVERLLPPELTAKYRRWVLRGFLSRSHTSRWCPRRDCSNVVRAATDVATVVRCLCGHLFCFTCGDEAHYPALCDTVKSWRGHYSASEQDARAQEWVRANTKPCPRCNSNIEKNGGCNHITCRKCTYEFCWICSAKWTSLHYTCQRTDPSKEHNKKATENLVRFTWYSDRWTAHDVSSRLEEAVRAKVTRKALSILESGDKAMWHEAAAVQQAAEVLIRCRLVLKWSFALGYKPPAKFNVPLFDFLQQDFEVAVDKLAYWLEHSSTDTKELRRAMRTAEHLLFGFLQFCEHEQQTRFYMRALMATSVFTLNLSGAADKRDLRASKGRLALSQSASLGGGRAKARSTSGVVYELTTECSIPRLVCGAMSSLRVSRIATSARHGLLLTDQGLLYAWGENEGGQLGVGSYIFHTEPTRVEFFGNDEAEPPTDIVAGSNHSFAITASGRVYAWGNNGKRQLGLGGVGYTCASPSRVSMRLEDHVVVQIATSQSFTLFLTQEGVIYGCGSHVGAGSFAHNEYPVRNPFFNPEVDPIRRIACNDLGSACVTAHGQAYRWGQFINVEPSPAPSLVVPRARTGETLRFRDVLGVQYHLYATTQAPGAPLTDLYDITTSVTTPVALPEPMAARAIEPRSVTMYSTSGVLYHLDAGALTETAQLSGLPVSAISWIKETLLLVVNDDSATLSGCLRMALKEGLCADVTFVAQGREFPVNRSLLLARCAAFAKEAFASSTDKVRLQLSSKLDAVTVEAFLEFLYTDQIQSVPPSSVKLLLALGRQYNLPRLIAICRDGSLPSTLSADLWASRASDSADAELVTPDGNVKAHRVVLASRVPYLRGLFRGGTVTQSTEGVSSVVSAEALVAWCYEQPLAFDAFVWEDLTALMLDADYLGATALQTLAEYRLTRHPLLVSNPLLAAELVPFSQGAMVRVLKKSLWEQRHALEERYLGKLVALDAFVRAVSERHAFLSQLHAQGAAP